jgi:2-keto-4-pentenoate hydratase
VDEAAVADIGRKLYEAERNATTLSPLRFLAPDLDPAGAYAIQEAYADLRRGDGAKLIGRKIGCTSQAIQELFGIDTPDFGHIFDDMVVEDGGEIAADALIAPMVEPEVAFLLERELRGPDVDRAAVLEATGTVMPCLEIIDSRIHDWQIEFIDTVADNGSSARCVFGTKATSISRWDLAEIEVTMLHNGQEVAKGTGAAVLGHPADSVAWLANALAPYGRSLRAGEYVLSGSMTTAVRAAKGDQFEADFGDFGRVSCEFI